MFTTVLFTLSAALTVASTILVITTKNIMHACVFLLGTLLGVAGLYVTLGADFVAATQLMVYVGGVVILMVFAVMLTGGKHVRKFTSSGELFSPMMGNFKSYFVGGLAGLVILLVLYKIIFRAVSLAQKQVPLHFKTTVAKIGKSLVTDHVLAFELSSILLLGALIGAVIIARARETGGKET